MGKKSGGGAPPAQEVSSTVTQSRLPSYAEPYYRRMMQHAEGQLQVPYQTYGGQRIAGFSPEQLGAFQGIQAVADRALPGIEQARSTAMEMASPTGLPPVSSGYTPGQLGSLYSASPITSQFNPGTIGSDYRAGPITADYRGREFQKERILDRMKPYQDPYQTRVLDRLQRRAIERHDEAAAKRGLDAAKSGAYGGSRHGIQDFLSRRDLEERLTDMEAKELQRGFLTSAQLGEKDIGQALRAEQLSDVSRRAEGQMGLTAQEVLERARQTEGQMGLKGQEATQRFAAEAGRQGMTAQQQSEMAKQVAARLGIQGFDTQERANQTAARLGLQAQLANQRAYDAQQQRRLRAAGLLPQIGQTEQRLDLQRLAALQDVGGRWQALRQQQLEQGYRDFIRQRDYPREQLAYYSQILQGLPVTPTSEYTQYQPRANPYAQALNTGLGALSMMRGMQGAV
ncbi:MAG: hypothetical protein GOVbin152_9 [Prokaryotic dsDNA virus sp.]|nr:MAG: hypothetical protein GOVbin152_9 [Prokaryotic dsDNA virus sp.]|tara:strand:- start:29165 stop:30529 length:1365 start_codon:yes stop_codon:yes gene_type:complete